MVNMKKKNQKAFTMVEMLGIVVIIALISLFSFPIVDKITNESKQKKYQNFLSVINSAANTYAELNFEKYNETTSQYISVKKLVEEGLISDTLVNPNTNAKIIEEDAVVVVTKAEDKALTYNYNLNEYLEIDSVEDLVKLSKSVDEGNEYINKIVILFKNLDFKDTNSYEDASATTFGDINGDGVTESLMNELTTDYGFNPIGGPLGDKMYSFKGNFVGNGNTISNIYINRKGETDIGLFYTIDGGNISGLTLKGTINGGGNVGLLSGKVINGAKIIDVNAETSIIDSIGSNIGGVIGYGNSIVLENISSNYSITSNVGNTGGVVGNLETGNCKSVKGNGVIDSNGNNIGGLFGTISQSILLDVLNEGKIIGGNNVGGIAGEVLGQSDAKTKVTKAINNASISSSSKGGGLFGTTSNSSVEISYNSGSIKGLEYTGGLAGNVNGTEIQISYSNATIEGGDITGGLIGASSESVINDTYNWGKVTGSNNVGGLAGKVLSTEINDSYNNGEVVGNNDVGGIIGYASNSSKLSKSYYNSDNTLQEGVVGNNSGLTITQSNSLADEQIQKIYSYTEWDFSNVWKDEQYPVLRMNGETSELLDYTLQ